MLYKSSFSETKNRLWRKAVKDTVFVTACFLVFFWKLVHGCIVGSSQRNTRTDPCQGIRSTGTCKSKPFCEQQCTYSPHNQFHYTGYGRKEAFAKTLQCEAVNKQESQNGIHASVDNQISSGKLQHRCFTRTHKQAGKLASCKDIYNSH